MTVRRGPIKLFLMVLIILAVMDYVHAHASSKRLKRQILGTQDQIYRRKFYSFNGSKRLRGDVIVPGYSVGTGVFDSRPLGGGLGMVGGGTLGLTPVIVDRLPIAVVGSPTDTIGTIGI